MSDIRTLLVVWQDEESRLYYHVGTLSNYDDYYEFTYTSSQPGLRKLGDALKAGYMIHPAFPKTDKVYRSKALFPALDRKSTRLNSSHVAISYAVFCLKKKKNKKTTTNKRNTLRADAEGEVPRHQNTSPS